MADEVKYKPTDKLGKVFEKYNYWSGNPSGKPLYNNGTTCGHCGGGCHGDGGCGGDGN